MYRGRGREVVVERVERGERRKRQDGEPCVGVMSAGCGRVDRLGVRLCGGWEWRPHYGIYTVSIGDDEREGKRWLADMKRGKMTRRG